MSCTSIIIMALPLTYKRKVRRFVLCYTYCRPFRATLCSHRPSRPKQSHCPTSRLPETECACTAREQSSDSFARNCPSCWHCLSVNAHARWSSQTKESRLTRRRKARRCFQPYATGWGFGDLQCSCARNSPRKLSEKLSFIYSTTHLVHIQHVQIDMPPKVGACGDWSRRDRSHSVACK